MAKTLKPHSMNSARLAQSLRAHLFCDSSVAVYAILDGAAIPGLQQRLEEDAPHYCCLYSGELSPDLAETAPYLVRLALDTPFTQWVLEGVLGNYWGMFAASTADLRTLRKHFRTFLMVRSTAAKPVYFRFYDPRTLRGFLPSCNSQETRTWFGPLAWIAVEGEEPASLARFWAPGDTQPSRTENIDLTRSLPTELKALTSDNDARPWDGPARDHKISLGSS